ncbi:hypothetical protein U0070_027179, partial [Myodes glareolus]
ALCPALGVGDQWSTGLYFLGCSTAQHAITGPDMVSGQEWGSLTVRCRYHSKWKNYKKYWCRGADWNTCEILVKTDKEQLVKKDRVSIRDDQTDFVVTVTMEELRKSDAGVYWCEIERIGYDYKFKIEEISTKITTIMVPVVTSTPPAWEDTSNHGQNQTSTVTWSLLSSIYFKILVFLELPLILSMLSAVLWVNRPQRCSGGGEVGLGNVQSSDATNREKNFQADRK